MKKSKMITKLKKNEIFVFGSNAEGNHAGGAAKLAKEKFGAKQGVARGKTGQCYAIDTMSGLDVIIEQIEPFLSVAEVCTDKTFLVTEIGCGIAGYTVKEIAPLFKKALGVKNIILPASFLEVLNKPVIVYGFKGYDKDLKCRNFQYEIGKEFEHEGEVSHCNSGFHFVKNPLDIFKYYPPKNGNRFTEVSGTGEISEDTKDTKIAVSKLKIGVEVNLRSIIETGVKFIFEKVKATKDLKETSSGNSSTSASSGNYSTSASSGNSSTSASSGNSSTSASSGNYSTSASSGNSSTSASSGNYSTSASSGYSSTSASSGYYSTSASSGDYSTSASSGDYSTSASSGNYSTSASSGYYSTSASSGDYSTSASSGNSSTSASSGNYSTSASSGNSSTSASSGDYSTSASSGYYSTSASSGNSSTSASSGDYSTSASSGDSSTSASSGNYSTSASSGYYSTSASSGNSSTSASSGNSSTSASSGNYSTSASSGDYSTSASSGYYSKAKVTGKNSIAVANGFDSKVSGVIDSYIVGSEYKDGVLIDVQVAKVDGEKIKENTWYQLKKGKFVVAD